MTDLLTRVLACDGNPQETAELILEAWLADNPEPDAGTPIVEWARWERKKRDMLDELRRNTPGALLGAVIDFILPEGWMITSLTELGPTGGNFARIGNSATCSSVESDDSCRVLALALLAACIKASNTSHE